MPVPPLTTPNVTHIADEITTFVMVAGRVFAGRSVGEGVGQEWMSGRKGREQGGTRHTI